MSTHNWKLYRSGNKYRIGYPTRWFGMNVMCWYHTTVIENLKTGTITRYDQLTMFETTDAEYAVKELLRLRESENKKPVAHAPWEEVVL